MILFDLNCGRGHRFEGWFRDGATFDEQAAAGEIACPVCGDAAVKKALMAPAVATRRGGRREEDDAAPAGGRAEEGGAPPPRPAQEPAAGSPPPPQPVAAAAAVQAAEAVQVLRRMRRYVERNFDHVGPRFAEEARRMHHGESERRGIYGDATAEEARELRDEGIEVARIPWLPPHDG